jgi:Uma2 family endonuclease
MTTPATDLTPGTALPASPFVPATGRPLPNHLQLPEKDETVASNFQEHPQSALLTATILPVLERRHPDGNFAIGQDSFIYWEHTDPPQQGSKAPDWFYIPHVPRLLDGTFRRSYVMWQEHVSPLIVIEYVSGDGSEERDQTPYTGKFWIYEQRIRAAYYAIYEVKPGRVTAYCLTAGKYELVPANERGHYPILPMGVELGIWNGRFQFFDLPWLRWWDEQGNLLLTADEKLEQERLRAERLAKHLRELGIDPDKI